MIIAKLKNKYLLYAALAFWVPTILFSKIAGEILEKEPIGADRSILFWIHAHATSTYDRLAELFSIIGGIEGVAPITLLLVGWLAYKRYYDKAQIIFLSVAGAAAANFILKLLFHRVRPALWPSLVHESSYSFPSGHAMVSSALILSIIAITWHSRARWLATSLGALLILFIGLSRLYLGVHYPTDVVAGWCAASAWVYIVCRYPLKRRQMSE